MKCSRFICVLAVLIVTATMSTYACTCVRNKKWTLNDELKASHLAVKGRVISVADYTNSEFPSSQKLFKLVIEKKYKSPPNTPDTVSIITGRDGASCGYAFKIDKEYIVYATNWNQNSAGKKGAAASSPDMFYTSICTLTKETNPKELAKLKRLTH